MIINPALYVKKDETPVFAEPITLGSGDLTYTTYVDIDDGNTYANITGFSYTGSFTSVKFPKTIDGYEIKKVSTYALGTGTFGSINKVVIPYAVTWDYITTSSSDYSKNRIASVIRALDVVNLPNPIDDCFFKYSYLLELKYQNNPIGAYGYAFYGAIIACEGMYNLIKGLKHLYLSRQRISSGVLYVNHHFYMASCYKPLRLDNLEDTPSNAQDYYSCLDGTFKSVYLPKLTRLNQRLFRNSTGEDFFGMTDFYLDSVTSIDFGTDSSGSQSPFYWLSVKNIYTTADNYDTLKALFDNAVCADYGRNLSSVIKIYDGTPPQEPNF